MAALQTLAPICTACIFGAFESTSLSFSHQVIKTIIVDVIPHITVYNNGTNITSYQSITETDAIVSASGTLPATTYTNQDEITWTVDGVTLTYPTTYIHYLAFFGAPATTSSGGACEQPKSVSVVHLPTTTDAASFIYPASNVTGAIPLPHHLLDYLDNLSTISQQFNGEPVTGCHPSRTASPSTAISVQSSSTPSSISYGGPRSSTTFQATSSLYGGNSTNSSSPTGNRTLTSILTLLPATTSTTEFASTPEQATLTTTTNAIIAPSATNAPENQHTTAYVIQPVTGQTIITIASSPETAPQPVVQGTTTSANDVGGGGSSSGSTPAPNKGGGGTSDSNSGSENLIGAVQSAAQQAAGGGSNPQATQNSIDLGNLVGAIQSAAQGSVGTQDGGSSPVFIAGGTTISANSGGQYQYGTQTLVPGGSITVGSGPSATVVALQTKGGSTELVVGGSTINGQPAAGQNTGAPSAGYTALITAGGQTFSAFQSGGSVLLVDGASTATIAPGSVATFEGQTVSAPAGGGAIVVGGSTFAIPASTTVGTISQAVFVAHGHTFTAIATGSAVVLQDGASIITVQDGSTATFDSETISALSNGAGVVDGGSTYLFTNVAAGATSSNPLATYIIGGINPAATSGPSGTAGNTKPSSGAGGLRIVWASALLCACLVGVIVVL